MNCAQTQPKLETIYIKEKLYNESMTSITTPSASHEPFIYYFDSLEDGYAKYIYSEVGSSEGTEGTEGSEGCEP